MEHAHGSAEDVPDRLRDLWSWDVDARMSAYEYLAEELGHQQSQYEATAAAVPFVIEVVADPAAPDRFLACRLLAKLAFGDGAAWLGPSSRLAQLRRDVARRARMSVDDLQRELAEWVAAAPTDTVRRRRERDADWVDVQERRLGEQYELGTYDAVRAGVPVYVEALRSDDTPLRLFAAYLLGWFPEDASASVPHLARIVATGSETALVATATVALGLLGRDEPDVMTVLRHTLRSPRRAEQWAAAIALARLSAAFEPDVVPSLYDCIRRGDAEPPVVPYLGGDMSGLAALTLPVVPHEAAPDRLDVLLERLKLVPPGPGARCLGQVIVDIAFPAGPVPDGATLADLSGDQRRAVAAFSTSAASADAWWWNELAARYGLPSE